MPDSVENMEITETVASFINQHHLLPARGKVVAGVSGGADSLCLLHLLNRLCGEGRRYPHVQLHAAHLDHQLRGEESARDAATVAALVTQWGLPITTGAVDVPALARAENRSIEDAARLARYGFLREVARQLSEEVTQSGQGERPEVVIAVGHQADDQVETLLLHWLRGSGLPGLVGMRPRQQEVIRPLLSVTRAQTREYCQQYGITFIEDPSNTDPTYTRNRVRHQLLPLLESITPGFRATLLRNAGVIAGDLDFIESQVDTYWPQVVVPPPAEEEEVDGGIQSGITMYLPSLLAVPVNIQRHLLRRAAEQLCGGQSPLELRHYAMIEDLLRLPPDRQPRELHLPRGLRLTRLFQSVVIECLSADWAESDEEEGAAQSQALRRARRTIPLRAAPATIPLGEEISPVEVRLSIPGEVMMPGTNWMARAELLAGDMIGQVLEALHREDWQQVWQLLPSNRFVVYVDAASVGKELIVHSRRPGDRMQPLGMAGEKKIQDILVDAHVPRMERDTIPLFFTTTGTEEGICIWLAGICLSHCARLTSQTESIVKLSLGETTP
jgi:tRNA(Ile)-lysidine synthase